MESKFCPTCSQTLSKERFYKNKAQYDGLYPICKNCTRAKNRRYNASKGMKERIINPISLEERKERNRRFLMTYLVEHPCVDCGFTDIRVLEFDHLPEFVKKLGVATLAKEGYDVETLQEEIDKCEVRCRNCHKIKTLERMGVSWHYDYLGDAP